MTHYTVTFSASLKVEIDAPGEEQARDLATMRATAVQLGLESEVISESEWITVHPDDIVWVEEDE